MRFLARRGRYFIILHATQSTEYSVAMIHILQITSTYTNPPRKCRVSSYKSVYELQQAFPCTSIHPPFLGFSGFSCLSPLTASSRERLLLCLCFGPLGRKNLSNGHISRGHLSHVLFHFLDLLLLVSLGCIDLSLGTFEVDLRIGLGNLNRILPCVVSFRQGLSYSA